MKRHDDDLDRLLDRSLGEIRDDQPDEQAATNAVDRVWAQLREAIPTARTVAPAEQSSIRSCADFQELLPGFLQGRVSGPRRLLLEDHLGECVPCRRKLKELRAAGRRTAAPVRARRAWFTSTLGKLAAAAVILVAVLGLSVQTDVFSFETHGLIRVESVDGELLRVSDSGTSRVNPGDVLRLDKGENLLTAKGSAASIRLADDSAVEMRERTGLAVMERKSLIPGRPTNGEIKLDRGSIIVEASEQGSGHLYVDTDDCRVAVQGTVFAVNHGVKGSRVSVIEGEVHVDHGRGDSDVLLPGDQSTTRESLGRVPVEHEIAWSRNLEKHLQLLAEMRVLGREMDEAIRPELRYDTALLDLVPQGTVIYAAMPNVATGMEDAYRILLQRVATNEALSEWWGDNVVGQGVEESLDDVISKIRDYGEMIDDEIVLTLQIQEDGEIHEPLFLARLTRPEAFVDFVRDEIAGLQGENGPTIVLIEGAVPVATPQAGNDTLYLWVRDELLAVAPKIDSLYALNSGSFGGTDFHQLLSRQYDEGVEWIAGVDIQTILRTANTNEDAVDSLRQLGLLDAQHLIASRRQTGDRAENRADLVFDRPRREMAAWLAEPAPMGALDYVSPNANLVTGFVMKDVGVVVDELFDVMGNLDDDFDANLAEIEAELGFDIRRDLARPLGGEFVLAIDGPMLPKPSWKLIFEAYDPQRLQETIQQIVEMINDRAENPDFEGLTLDMQVGSTDYFHIFSPDAGMGLHFAYDGGYLIVGPSRADLERALQIRSSGLSIVDSQEFRDLLPDGDEVNFSAVLYQNLGSLLGSLPALGAITGAVPSDQQQMLQQLAGETRPSLALVYGGRDRISLVSTSEGGLFSSSLGSLLSVPGFMGVQESLLQSMEQGAIDRQRSGI